MPVSYGWLSQSDGDLRSFGSGNMSLPPDAQAKNVHAQRLFDGIARSYEWPAEAFSFFQYGRWRRFLVSQLRVSPQALVLDVCTGTGLVASEIEARFRCRVVGIDLSDGMIEQAQRNLKATQVEPAVSLVKGCAESLPFADNSFDTVVFTYLLRYVEDPQATLGELSRVLRPGGQMASLEFFVPRSPIVYALWLLHTRLAIPVGSRLLPGQWREVGSFLGPSISDFYRKHTLRDLSEMWARAGIGDLQNKLLSFGGAVTMWGRKGGLG